MTQFISRAEWGARAPKLSPKPLASFDAGWFVHWLGVAARPGLSDAQVLRDTQAYHQGTKGWNDIAYSFAIGREHPDTVYELRGYGIQGGHTEGYNSQSMAIVFLLGTGERPTDTMLDTARTILAEGVRRGYPADLVRPHNAVRSTACPGPDLTAWVNAGRFTVKETTVPTPPTANPYPAATAEALELLAQHAGYVGDRLWFGPDALEALHRLKNQVTEVRGNLDLARGQLDARAANIISLANERDTARANHEAAEAEVAMLRKQLQEGGRLPQLLADLDAASKDLDRAANAIAEAITKARA